jgi:hypothetical protein
MPQKISHSLIVLLIFIIVAPLAAGCGVSPARGVHDPGVDPFVDDRIATVRLVLTDEAWQYCREHAFEEQYVRADFWWDDELVPDVGLRPKGNSSLGQAIGWDSPRLPLCVDFNIFNRARSFHGVKKVFLNNGWSDPTLIREMVAYKVFAAMGIPTPRAALIDLWANDTHLGVYTMVEMVDQSFISLHFDDDTGNLYKPEVLAARLDWTEADIGKDFSVEGFAPLHQQDSILYTNIGGAPLIDLLRALGQEELVAFYEPQPELEGSKSRGLPPSRAPQTYLEAMMLKTNENDPDYSGLFNFLEVLNNEPGETFPQEIEKVLDVDTTLKFIAVSAVILHLDNYIGIGHNNYIYEANGVFTPIPWDTNMAFGTFNQGIRKEGLINYYIDEPTAGKMYRYPLVKRLLDVPAYRERYHGYVEEVMNGPFAPEVIQPRIDRLAEMVRPYAAADTEMFYAYEDWERCLTEDLRPPDIFEGWMAGGPSPILPFFLHRAETACLQTSFGVNNLYELLMHDFQPGELETLEGCLEKEHYELFLQNVFGPMMAPQPPRQPGFGPNSLGLKTFIAARYEAVRRQLDGEQRSGSGFGSGNGGSLWIADFMEMAN